MLGRAPVVDFDGTLARLGLPWDHLRNQLGVERISQLWADPSSDWDTVRLAEEAAAVIAPPVPATMNQLAGVEAFAILTNNSEASAWRFLERFEILTDRIAVVVGRETLHGPKTDFARFSAGFARCVEATADVRGDETVAYLGDQVYELEFANRLGARALDVHDLDPSRDC